MKSTTMTSSARWVCLAGLIVGCGSVNDAGQDKRSEERTGHGHFAFTTEQTNACVNGCTGGVLDGTCDAAENNFTCAQDCACGDGECSGAETQSSCPIDCKYGTDPSPEDDFCGNGRCEPWEHDGAAPECANDCHAGPEPMGTICGDADCDPGETSASCKADCGNTSTCGNQMCEPSAGETFATCDADCTNFNVPAGRFVGTYCNGYALYAQYADGNGGFVDHLVTSLAGGCGGANDTAYPWKLISNAGTCDGSTLLKPDGTTCTIQGAICSTDATWAALGTDYAMAGDPNKCFTYRMHYGAFQPLTWAKVGMQDCAQTPCTVYQCGGQSTPVNTGTAALWRPQIARWSIYANQCQ